MVVVAFVAIVLLAGVSRAEWSEAVCHSELNDFENGFVATEATVSSDGLTIYFGRQVTSPTSQGNYQLFEATRPEPEGPFTEIRALVELNPIGHWIRKPWLSKDGLRLYYTHAIEEGTWNHYKLIKMATKDPETGIWQESRGLWELHVTKTADFDCSLTADELNIIWCAKRPDPFADMRIYTASRESVNEPFSNEREITELTDLGALHPYLFDDGLRIYFNSPNAESGIYNIFVASRESLNAPFGTIELMDGICGPDLPAHRPWVSSDEKTIYFNSYRGDFSLDELGIWVSYWIDDPYDVFVESVEAAIAEKNEALVHVAEALAKQVSALEALNDLRDVGEIDGVNILQAKMSILHAIHRQIKARLELKKGIKELEDSLKKLRGEFRDKPSPKTRKSGRRPNGPKSPRIR